MKMTPSERIKRIREISNKLSRDEWRFVNVALRQFSIRTMSPDDYYGSLFEYVSDMLEDESDETLIDLATHLEIALNDSPVSIPDPPFWKEDFFKLFLSHVSAFKKETAELQQALSLYGITSFVAHEDIEPTKEWQSEIEAALKTMDGLAALLTKNFHESKWTDQEVGVAIGRKVPIISIRFELDPYGFIGKYQGLQGNGKTMRQVAKEIMEILLASENSQPKMIHGLVHSFIGSNSFAESKEIIEFIEKAPYLPDTLLQLLENSIKENSQVGSSWGVPERVKALRKKYMG
jgi:hypothetical protein